MPVIFTQGDMLHTDGVRAFAHACDATFALDKGVSRALARRWPALADELARVKAAGPVEPGDVVAWTDGEVHVYSLVVQRAPDKPAKVAALERATRALLERAVADGRLEIATGRLGAGAPGLDWTRVKKVLTELTEASPVSLLVFEKFVRERGVEPEEPAAR